MNIHEYQAKGLLRSYGAPVSDGRIVVKSEDAKTAAGELDGPIWVVKAQIHAGGRGKGSFKEQDAGESGGVRIAKSVEQAGVYTATVPVLEHKEWLRNFSHIRHLDALSDKIRQLEKQLTELTQQTKTSAEE